MDNYPDNFEDFLATTAEMLVADGLVDAADLLKSAVHRVEATGYDNWNGGTTNWTIYLQLNPREYASLGKKKDTLASQINSRLSPLLEQETTDWYSVVISPKVQPKPDWRKPAGDIPKSARKNIFDGMRLENASWFGSLGDVEFLGRLYDLENLPSTDSRFQDAAGDIWQHRVNNDDWPEDWIFDDSRFRLMSAPPDEFLRFLCEVLHPVVRPDRNETLKLLQHFNDQLRPHGWHLIEEEKIAGRPRYVGQAIRNYHHRSVSRARTVADALDAGWMQKEIERVENAIDADPALALGTAKELLESCCKTILTKRGVSFGKSDDLPKLTKALTKELKLVPEGIPDAAKGAENIRLILRNLSALTQYMAELRGLYGTGHGRDGKHKGLEPRHARLAVASAVAFIDFVTETYHQRIEANDSAKMRPERRS